MDENQTARQSVSNGFHHSSSRRSSTNKESCGLPPMESQNWLMHLYYTRGQVDKAKLVIQEELRQSSGKNEFAHYLLASIFVDENKLTEALEEYQACNKLNPSHIEYIKKVGVCLFRQKRYKMALEALMEAENLSKKLDWEIHYWIAECLTMLGSRETAVQWSTRAAKTSRSPMACVQLAKLLDKAGDKTGALIAYQAALENSPDDPDLLTSVGLLHALAGQQQLAVERLGSALAIDTPKAKALLPLAAIMQSHRDYDVALSRYKIAAQQTPDCAALWNNIGMCFFGKQKIVAAISCLKRATALTPLAVRVMHNLGLVHLSSQQYSSAFQFLCAALNLRPANATTFVLMAITLNQLDDQGNALKAYEQAILLAPDHLFIRINYTIFLYSQKLFDQAKHHFETCETLASNIVNLDKEYVGTMNKLRIALGDDVVQLSTPLPEEPGGESVDKDVDAKDNDVNSLSDTANFDPDEV